ncbi:hypothetical protein [Sphingomonas asaccharolytica]|uniref:hypothetical protein n=1 Tax=Sphingomonas asaccharolytica TaxID=40681 RepID=UPI00082A19D2|nr:hypothetical protein [Sphingomonas asaccharolytica]
MTEDAAVAALIDSFEPARKGPAAKGVGKPAPEDADPDEDATVDDQDEGEDEDGAEDSDNESDDDDQDAAEDSQDDEEAEDEEDDKSGGAAEAADDQVVKVTVNGETQEFTVASLKRLAGQEASLTRKSQEADLVGGRAAAALQAAIEASMEDLQPYADVDWLTLQNEMDPEEFAWHRKNAARAEGRHRKLMEQAQGFEQVMQQRKQADTIRRAEEASAVLAKDMPGWGDQLYGDIIKYGASQGLDEADVANIVDANVIKLLHKAMLHDRGQQAAAKKVTAAPTKVIKPGSRDEAPAKAATVKKAVARLSKTGSDADAMAVLMGRWA